MLLREIEAEVQLVCGNLEKNGKCFPVLEFYDKLLAAHQNKKQ